MDTTIKGLEIEVPKALKTEFIDKAVKQGIAWAELKELAGDVFLIGIQGTVMQLYEMGVIYGMMWIEYERRSAMKNAN